MGHSAFSLALAALCTLSCVNEGEQDRPATIAGGPAGLSPGSSSVEPSDEEDEDEPDEVVSGAGGEVTTPGLGWQDTCGDGSLDPGEACDDGNQEIGDGCDAVCCAELSNICCDSAECYQAARRPCHCGDGIVDFDEECDDGNLTWGDGCSGYCAAEGGLCGDGNQDPGEGCDDGNLEPGDGCDPSCIQEIGCF